MPMYIKKIVEMFYTVRLLEEFEELECLSGLNA
jgi:hypothetical protein